MANIFVKLQNIFVKIANLFVKIAKYIWFTPIRNLPQHECEPISGKSTNHRLAEKSTNLKVENRPIIEWQEEKFARSGNSLILEAMFTQCMHTLARGDKSAFLKFERKKSFQKIVRQHFLSLWALLASMGITLAALYR